MRYLSTGFRYLLRFVAGFFFITGLYLFVAGICSCIPVNSDFTEEKNGIEIAVISNGVHTDIAVPVKNETADWSQLLPCSDVKEADSSYRYISFGWGDKGFYIETPTWADLKASTAFKAMFWLSSSAMHVTWRKDLPADRIRCRRFRISKEKYALLCQYIRDSFCPGTSCPAQCIKAPSYGRHDAFYEARGTYNLFRTCNVWTGEGLKIAGVKVALWTPFEKGVFQQLP